MINEGFFFHFSKRWHQCYFIFFFNQGLPDFLGGSDGKASTYNAGGLGRIPGLGRSSGERNGNPLQYSCLENPMDGAVWQSTVLRVAKNQTWLSDFTSHHFSPLQADSLPSEPPGKSFIFLIQDVISIKFCRSILIIFFHLSLISSKKGEIIFNNITWILKN